MPQHTSMFTFDKMEAQEGFHVLAHTFPDKETMQIEISMVLTNLDIVHSGFYSKSLNL